MPYNPDNPDIIQRVASDPSLCICVNASAGTGKTKILTDRFLRLLLEGNNIKNILCITFTNAAANEMLVRIKTRLQNWLLMPYEELKHDIEKLTGKSINTRILEQARNLYSIFLNNTESLKIHTIHSFCLSILQDIPTSAHIKIIDSIKENEILDYAINKSLQEGDKKLLQSIKLISEIYEYDKIREVALNFIKEKRKIITALTNYPDIKATVYKKLGAKPDLDANELIPHKIPGHIQKLITTLSDAEETKLATSLEDQRDNFNFSSYKAIFLTKDDMPRKRLLKKKFKEQYFIETDSLFTEQHNIYLLVEQIKTQQCAKYNTALLTFLLTVFSNYTSKTNQLGLIDYDEIIIKTFTLLQDSENIPEFLYNIDMRIDHILLDEAQDTNPLQWDLIKILSEEFFSGQSARSINRTVFFVGDFKQSIYSFQGAEPESFNNAQEFYSNAIENMKQVNMQTSFRTTRPVLNLVNAIFNNDNLKRCITKNKEKIEHIPFRTGSGYVDVMPLTEIEKNDEKETRLFHKKYNEINIKRNHAQNIAFKIKQILDSKRLLYGHEREVKPSDIMVLVRKRSELVRYLMQELKNYNIAVSDLDRIKLDANLIVQDLLSITHFLNLPYDDLNLAALLKSPIIGITEQELFKLAFQRKEKSLFHALKDKCPEHYQYLNSLLNSNLQLSQLYSKILEQDNKLQVFLERFGKTANMIIDAFIELLLEYEKDNIQSVSRFLKWFATSKPEIKNEFTTQNNEVQIMTVHAAKGLQAPIVFLADATPYRENNSDNIFWDDDGSIYFGIGSDNEKIKQVKEKQKYKDWEESIRLLYVAITRAEDELYVCGYKTNETNSEQWYDIIKNNLDKALQKPEDITITESENIISKSIASKPSFLKKANSSTNIKPSKPAPDNKMTRRGTLIHSLLYLLPQIEDQQCFHNNFIETNVSKSFSVDELNEIIKIAQQTINNFPDLFNLLSKKIKSEVPIMVMENGKNALRQIDKLIIDSEIIKIIDFKTGKPSQSSEKKYSEQLEKYKNAIASQYPKQKIECYILWIDQQKLVLNE